MTEEDECLGLHIVSRGFEYGYVKANNGEFYQPKTSWCLSPYGYVSDVDIEGVHKIAFKCKTKQDKKIFKYVLIDADKVTNFNAVRNAVMKQVGGSFIFGDLSQPLWKKMMLKHIDVFVNRCFKLLKPVRNAGYQLHLLSGENMWKPENVEVFFNPEVGILGCDGQPKRNPQSIYVPSLFPSNQPLGRKIRLLSSIKVSIFCIVVKHVETGASGVLEHLDVPYAPSSDGMAYWECIVVHLAGLLLHNQPYLFKIFGIAAMPVIMG